MNEVRATSIFDVFEIKIFHQKLEKLLFTSVLSDPENFVSFSGKPDWLSPSLSMYWSCSPHFYLRKGGGFPR